MLRIFLDRFAEDPTWLTGALVITLLMLILVCFSFFRNIRRLAWFSMAGMVTAGVYLFSILEFPVALQWLSNYRIDWALLALVHTINVSTVFMQLLIYIALFILLALTIIAALGLWSLLTFRFQRCRIIFRRSISESWMVLVFALTAVIVNLLLVSILGRVNLEQLGDVFQLMSFVFCLQLFLRLIDTAYLHTPKLFMEFSYSTGLMMLLFTFFFDWFKLLSGAVLDHELFLNQLFSFFLGLLVIGILSHFFVRAFFASTFFLEIAERRSLRLFVWTSRLLLTGREATFAHRKILIGVIFSLLIGIVFLLLVFQGWNLALIPAFFLGYFILFYFLDRQDDARIRGDIVEKRIESAVAKL